MFSISRQDSKAIQGLAFLLMLFLHLFNRMQNVDLCTTFLSIKGIPLIHILTKGCGPVPFFVVLSGYGLYVAKFSIGTRLKRALRLYVFYWLTLILFVGLGSYLNPVKYPGFVTKAVLNALGFYDTYNSETWFLLPYVLTSLLFGVYLEMMRYLGKKWILLISLVMTIAAQYLISRIGVNGMPRLTYQLVLTAGFMFPFVWGMVLCDVSQNGVSSPKWQSFFSRSSLLLYKSNWFIYLFLLLFFIADVVINNSLFHILFAFAVIILFPHIKKGKVAFAFLQEIGRKSMVMWLIHTYFCYYLFHDWIYGLKYPIVIYLVMLIITYIASLPFYHVGGKIAKWLRI